MLTGRDTLSHLSKTVHSARTELARLDRNLQDTSHAVAVNRKQQGQALKRLAAMRLDAVQQGDVIGQLEAADREVQQILDQRDKAIAALNDRVEAATKNLAELEENRERLHDDVDAAAEQLAKCEAAAQQALESSDEFRAQLDRTREADAIAVSAAEKALIALEDRRSKSQPFESDELFMYLWKRGYGTSEYRANPLARMLDAWVAGLCDYQKARPNYWLLLEIPKRLNTHAERRRAEADREVDALRALEESQAQDAGVHAAKSSLDGLEKRQDAIDADIAGAEAALLDLRVEQSRFSTGDDDYSAACLKVFVDTLRRREVAELTRLARATMTVEDDSIVNELALLRREEDELQNEFERNREVHREHLRRVQELEQVRQRFKQNRYDDLRSGFDNGDKIVAMIGEVLGGAIRGGALWDVLRQHQRYRDVAGAWPDFGSGGIAGEGRRAPARRPTWHWPGRSRSGRRGGFRLPRPPRAPRGGRGGFRTGGGF